MTMCSRCNGPLSKKGSFTIPTGTAKTIVTVLQCRGCHNVDIDIEEKDN
jgi:RNase P subunit RPR2